jgi:hypothetical protein
LHARESVIGLELVRHSMYHIFTWYLVALGVNKGCAEVWP